MPEQLELFPYWEYLRRNQTVAFHALPPGWDVEDVLGEASQRFEIRTRLPMNEQAYRRWQGEAKTEGA